MHSCEFFGLECGGWRNGFVDIMWQGQVMLTIRVGQEQRPEVGCADIANCTPLPKPKPVAPPILCSPGAFKQCKRQTVHITWMNVTKGGYFGLYQDEKAVPGVFDLNSTVSTAFGSYDWTIPASVSAGDKYTVRIIFNLDGQNEYISTASFSIDEADKCDSNTPYEWNYCK